MSDLVLGVDGGGSKTLVALADRSGRVVRTARSGGTNPLDNPAWRTELLTAINAVVGTPNIVAAAAALPTYGEVEALSLAQTQAVASVLGDHRPQSILNDVDAAQIGAFAGAPGILILSGTGSMAWARDAAGRSHRTGGWGDVLGDEGSAFWIGQRILSAVTQSVDGRMSPTGMAEALYAQIGADIADPQEALEGWVSHLVHPRSAIAALAPIAMRLAEAGDARARAIVFAAADELARHVTAIQPRVGRDVPWSYAGGTFNSPFLLAAVTERIARRPVPPRLPPIGGALLAAARLADWSTENAWIERLQASLKELSSGQTTLELTTT